MHNSYHEIFEQDDSLKKSFDYIRSKEEDIRSFFELNQYSEIVFVACGSSYWLSLSAAETFFEKLGIRSTAITSGDVIMNPENYLGRFPKPLLIVPSRSGNTTETIQAVKFLKSHYGCKALGIVEYDNTELQHLVEFALHIPWANEASICQTRSFSNLYLCCIMIAGILKNDRLFLEEISEYIGSFRQLRDHAEKEIQQLMRSTGQKNLVALGNGKLYGVMCEGAYITIEMAQAPAHYFYTLEFRHGPIVLLDSTYLVIIYSAGDDPDFEEKLIMDIQAKEAKVMVISAEDTWKHADVVFSMGKKCSPEVVALFASFVTQAMAYYKATVLNVNPDNPKDLVPWIQI